MAANPKPPAIQEIVILGELASGIAPIARFGYNEWEAAPDELFDAFRASAKAAAQAGGAASVVFGGLPVQN